MFHQLLHDELSNTMEIRIYIELNQHLWRILTRFKESDLRKNASDPESCMSSFLNLWKCLQQSQAEKIV